MGKYKHHSGTVGGGVNLSNAETPHDKNIKDMPLFRMGKPYEMGMSMRGPLDKHGKVFPNSWEEEDVKRGRKEMEEGHYKHGEDLFDDAHGSWNWGKSHHSTGAERGPLNNDNAKSIMAVIEDGNNKSKGLAAAAKKAALGHIKTRGPLNQNTYQQSSFEAMSEEEFKKRQNERNAKKAAKQGSAEAAAEGAGELGKNQELKTKMERKITEKKPKKA